MKRPFIASAAALAAMVFSAGAFAQAAYVGVSAGRSRLDLDCAGTTSCDRTDTAAKIFGGYMFMPNFGAEVAYYDLGKATVSGVDPTLGTVSGSLKGTSFGVFGVAAAPFGQFSVFGKLGAVSTKAKVEASSASLGIGGSDSQRHTNLGWGLGASYEITNNLGLRAEFERLRVEFDDNKDNADLYTVGVHYRF
jgi:OOP family OmpA-OmpF porin